MYKNVIYFTHMHIKVEQKDRNREHGNTLYTNYGLEGTM